MTLVTRIGEGVARRTNRRKAVKQAVSMTFGLVAAWATQGPLGSGALAATCAIVTEGDCDCNPPGIGYCSTLDPSFCNGASCSGGCTYDLEFYPAACWCTAACGPKRRRAYYKCCDCSCPSSEGSVQCACRRRIQVRSGR